MLMAADAPKKASKKGKKSRRGFAAMDPALVRKLAQKGGRAAHEQGTAHEFTKEEARIAGRKGGLAPHPRQGAKQR
jgi:general stress protein YciG